jgi:hypothetical protein
MHSAPDKQEGTGAGLHRVPKPFPNREREQIAPGVPDEIRRFMRQGWYNEQKLAKH